MRASTGVAGTHSQQTSTLASQFSQIYRAFALNTVHELIGDPKLGAHYRNLHVTDKEGFDSVISSKLTPFLAQLYGTPPNIPAAELFVEEDNEGQSVF